MPYKDKEADRRWHRERDLRKRPDHFIEHLRKKDASLLSKMERRARSDLYAEWSRARELPPALVKGPDGGCVSCGAHEFEKDPVTNSLTCAACGTVTEITAKDYTDYLRRHPTLWVGC